MAKRTFEEKQKRQRDKLMGTSAAEIKEYTPAVDEKDKFIEKYRKKGYKVVLENNTPIILCKDRKEMINIKEKMDVPEFSFGFRFVPSKYDDLLDKPLIDDKIPLKNKGKVNTIKIKSNSREKHIEIDNNIDNITEAINSISNNTALNILDKKDSVNEEKIFNEDKPKRRGRPRKVVKADIKEETKPITKKRGRPKKHIEETVESPSISPIKKRGRPKKDVVLVEASVKIEEKPKAKRGRPKKTLDSGTDVKTNETISAPKRRGRPRKEK